MYGVHVQAGAGQLALLYPASSWNFLGMIAAGQLWQKLPKNAKKLFGEKNKKTKTKTKQKQKKKKEKKNLFFSFSVNTMYLKNVAQIKNLRKNLS